MDESPVQSVYEGLNDIIRVDGSDAVEILSLASSMDIGTLNEKTREIIGRMLGKAKLIIDRTDDGLNLSDALYKIAITDSLTGLFNKRYFDEVLKPGLERINNLSYLMIDIDHFKDYNDSFGHQQGDKALIAVSNVIQTVSEGDITIRYGGEEFSVILVGYEDYDRHVHKHAEEIRQEVERTIISPYSEKETIGSFFDMSAVCSDLAKTVNSSMVHFFNDKDINHANYSEKLNEHFGAFGNNLSSVIIAYLTALQKVTVSVGGASRKEDESVDEVINRADKSLYKAKETRNKVVIAR